MTMLTKLTLSAFGDEVASASPAPGGGSAAALVGGVAAGLVGMVCRLSLGKETVAATDEELTAAIEQSDRLRIRLLELVDEDTAAFAAIMDAIHLPRDSEEQRTARAVALAEAKLGAARPPLETLSASRDTLVLAASLTGRTNRQTASDLGVAVQLALAAAEGALLNVEINLATLPPGETVDLCRHESLAASLAARKAAADAATATGAEPGIG